MYCQIPILKISSPKYFVLESINTFLLLLLLPYYPANRILYASSSSAHLPRLGAPLNLRTGSTQDFYDMKPFFSNNNKKYKIIFANITFEQVMQF